MSRRREGPARHELLHRRLAVGGLTTRPVRCEAERDLIEGRGDETLGHAVECAPKVNHAARRRRLAEHHEQGALGSGAAYGRGAQQASQIAQRALTRRGRDEDAQPLLRYDDRRATGAWSHLPLADVEVCLAEAACHALKPCSRRRARFAVDRGRRARRCWRRRRGWARKQLHLCAVEREQELQTFNRLEALSTGLCTQRGRQSGSGRGPRRRRRLPRSRSGREAWRWRRLPRKGHGRWSHAHRRHHQRWLHLRWRRHKGAWASERFDRQPADELRLWLMLVLRPPLPKRRLAQSLPRLLLLPLRRRRLRRRLLRWRWLRPSWQRLQQRWQRQ